MCNIDRQSKLQSFKWSSIDKPGKANIVVDSMLKISCPKDRGLVDDSFPGE